MNPEINEEEKTIFIDGDIQLLMKIAECQKCQRKIYIQTASIYFRCIPQLTAVCAECLESNEIFETQYPKESSKLKEWCDES